jgi:hypothetical protein
MKWFQAVVPGAVMGLLIVSAAGDGYFRDEFYYLACSRRLAWGYVDHPPASVALLWFVRVVAGDSLLVLRVVAALAAAAVVVLTGVLARRLGAGAFGQLLAMIGMAVAPGMLAIASFYSMNVFDVLIWIAAALVLVDTLERPTIGRWASLGVVLGLGLLNKLSVLWLGAGIGLGLLLTDRRQMLATPGPWIAAAVSAALLLPHVLWQIAYGWPTVEFIRTASLEKMEANSPASFLLDQVMNLHPFTLPVWGAGLFALLAAKRFERCRLLGIAFLAVAAILIANRTSRSIYLLAAYPVLMAAGGAWWEPRIAHPMARAASIGLLAAGGLLTAPLAVPILPVESSVRYSAALGQTPDTEEKQELGRLPQFFADRQQWPQLVAQVGEAWDRLTPRERQRGAILTGNYGEAGAIELLGRSRGMTAISGHNNYWLWGPGSATGDALVVLSRDIPAWTARCASLEPVTQTSCGDCMPYENQLPILICRELRQPLATLWPELKRFQ